MGMETTGKLHTIFETKQVSERFTKREFVVEIADNPKYPQVVQFQLTGDRCSQLDGMRVGGEVRIEFSLRGREWCHPTGGHGQVQGMRDLVLNLGRVLGGGVDMHAVFLRDGGGDLAYVSL